MQAEVNQAKEEQNKLMGELEEKSKEIDSLKADHQKIISTLNEKLKIITGWHDDIQLKHTDVEYRLY